MQKLRQFSWPFICLLTVGLLHCGPGFFPFGQGGNGGSGGGGSGVAGSLDSTFSEDGISIIDEGNEEFLNDVVIDNQQRIVVTGTMTGGGPATGVIYRYLSSGIADTNFAGNGQFVPGQLVLQTGEGIATTSAADDYYVVGKVTTSFSIVKANSDGGFDAVFAANAGFLIEQFAGIEAFPQDIAIDSLNRIIVVGSNDPGATIDSGISRVASAGSLDGTFSGDGRFSFSNLGQDDVSYAAVVLPDNKVIAAGKTTDTGGASDDQIGVGAVATNGSLFLGFDLDGLQNTGTLGAPNEQGRAAFLQSDNRVVVAGYQDNSVALMRYLTTGTPDIQFNGGALVTTGRAGSSMRAYGAALQSDGKIVVVGSVSTGGETNVLVMRYLSGGSLDTSFDSDGMVQTDLSSSGLSSDGATAVAIQSNGKLVVVGGTNADGTVDGVILRYNP